MKRRSTLDAGLLRSIAQTVEAKGGTYDDALDLVAVWERVQTRNDERACVIRREVAERPALTEIEREPMWSPPSRRPRRRRRREHEAWGLL